MEKEFDDTAPEGAPPQEARETDEVETLRRELEYLQDQLMEERAFSKNYLDAAKRIQAEFDNYKKRQEREMEKVVETANDRLILELLLILDDFERALNSIDSDEFSKGVKQIHSNLSSLLRGRGLKEIPTEGRFNPRLHEALCVGEGEDGEIIEVYQKGYLIGDRVLRHSKVKVGKVNEEGE